MVPPPASEPSEVTPLLGAGAAVTTVAVAAPAGGAAGASAEERPDLRRGIDWGRLLTFIGPYLVPRTFRLRVLGALSLLCTVLSKVSNLLPPLALKWAVDIIADNAARPADKRLAPLIAVLLFFVGGALTAILRAARSVTYAIVSTENTMRFSVDLFRHLQFLDLAYHIRRKTGEVNRIMDRGADSIDTLMNTFLFTLAPTLLEALLVTAIFLHLGTPLIAVVTFASVVCYAWFTKAITELRIRFKRLQVEAENAVSEKAVDSLINFETVKMFGMEEYEVQSYSDLQLTALHYVVKLRVSLGGLNVGQALIRAAGVSISLALAALGAAQGRLTAGDFVLINAYIAQLFVPLSFLGTSYRIIVRAATDIEKCIKLLDTYPIVVDREDAVPLKISENEIITKAKGELQFRNVSFHYKTDSRLSGGIRNINLTVRPGRMLGIVGPSGSGKSTLVRLCLRLYDPDEGSVTFDGVDIRQYTQQSLRQHYGVVSQDTSLFNRTLRYNIAYGNVDASDTEIYSAVNAAQLKNFCADLPEQLDTIVGERGIRLSGGEKQRVGVARCIIRSPVLVLLDEASSSLDSETEREMQASLREVCQGRTTIAVAHRLSTVMMADEIIVLDKGCITERGTHSELLELGGKYASMWTAQTEAEKSDDEKLKANGV